MSELLEVAKQDDSPYSNDTAYILARWGDELDNFQSLAKKAVEIWREGMRASMLKVLREVEADIASLDQFGLSQAAQKSSVSYYGVL